MKDSSKHKLPQQQAEVKGRTVEGLKTKQRPWCRVCRIFFIKNNHLRRHDAVCHGGGNFRCPLCPCSFGTSCGRAHHVRQRHAHSSRDYKSTIERTKSLRARQPSRIPDQGKERRQCPECGIWVAHRSLHLRVAHQGGKFPCKQCSCVFRTTQALTQHQRHKHKIGEVEKVKPSPREDSRKKHKIDVIVRDVQQVETVRVVCEDCGNILGKGKLESHLQVAHRGGNFRCQGCPCVFKSSPSLRFHINESHRNGRRPLPTYLCPNPMPEGEASEDINQQLVKVRDNEIATADSRADSAEALPLDEDSSEASIAVGSCYSSSSSPASISPATSPPPSPEILPNFEYEGSTILRSEMTCNKAEGSEIDLTCPEKIFSESAYSTESSSQESVAEVRREETFCSENEVKTSSLIASPLAGLGPGETQLERTHEFITETGSDATQSATKLPLPALTTKVMRIGDKYFMLHQKPVQSRSIPAIIPIACSSPIIRDLPVPYPKTIRVVHPNPRKVVQSDEKVKAPANGFIMHASAEANSAQPNVENPESFQDIEMSAVWEAASTQSVPVRPSTSKSNPICAASSIQSDFNQTAVSVPGVSTMTSHKKIVPITKTFTSFPCLYCGKMFICVEALLKHVECHKKICGYCNRGILSQELSSHLQRCAPATRHPKQSAP